MTSRSERAVSVLSETDPQFSALCDLLYGPGVDADAVWADVYGSEPIAKLSERKKHVAETVGLGATLIGGGLGIKELAEQAGKIKGGGRINRALSSAGKTAEHHMGRLVPKQVADNAQLRTGIAGGMILGDAAATTALATSEKSRRKTARAKGTLKPTKAAVEKAGATKVVAEAEKHAAGLIASTKKAEAVAQKLTRFRARPLHSLNEVPGKLYRTAKANPGKAAVVGGTGLVGTAAIHDMRKPKVPETELIKRLEAPMDEFEAAGTFSKFDDDKRLAFGWASVVSKNGAPVIDRQGDYMTIDDVEDAAYRYVLSSRIGGDMHKRNGESPHHVSDLVESMVFTKEKIAKMGLPDGFPEAWWVGFKVHDDDTWNLVKSDKRSGFSIHGRGKRSMHELDSVMDY